MFILFPLELCLKQNKLLVLFLFSKMKMKIINLIRYYIKSLKAMELGA